MYRDAVDVQAEHRANREVFTCGNPRLLHTRAGGLLPGVIGRTLAAREITDARIVADLFARINGLPSAGLGAILFPPCRFPPRPDTLMYSFRFTRWGLPVEVATLVEQGCSVWEFIRGGIPGARNDPTGRQTQAILDEAQPLPK